MCNNFKKKLLQFLIVFIINKKILFFKHIITPFNLIVPIIEKSDYLKYFIFLL